MLSSKCSSFENFKLLFVYTFYIIVVVETTSGHPISNPGTFSLTQVSKFPFYQKLVNPCGFSQGIPAEDGLSSVTTTAEPLDEPAFTKQFLTDMVSAINLTKGSLDNLKEAVKDAPGCTGISLNSLPETPPLEPMNELNTMKIVYKSTIYLVAHLHIVSLDRETVDVLNEVSDYDPVANDDDAHRHDFLCGNEPTSFIEIVEELTRRFESILCTVISGANLKERASFRPQLEQLEATKIFRYHSSCLSFQTRDCIVFREVDKVLKNIEGKFNRLVSQFSQRRTRIRSKSVRVQRRSTSTVSQDLTSSSNNEHSHQFPEIDNNI